MRHLWRAKRQAKNSTTIPFPGNSGRRKKKKEVVPAMHQGPVHLFVCSQRSQRSVMTNMTRTGSGRGAGIGGHSEAGQDRQHIVGLGQPPQYLQLIRNAINTAICFLKLNKTGRAKEREREIANVANITRARKHATKTDCLQQQQQQHEQCGERDVHTWPLMTYEWCNTRLATTAATTWSITTTTTTTAARGPA